MLGSNFKSDNVEPNSWTLWRAANNQQWQLVKELLDHADINQVYINVNWVPVQEENEGITVLWLLAFYHQWGLIERILTHYPVERVDINAAPSNESHPNRGTTVLWWLAIYQQWGLVERILTHYPVERVDINAAPTRGATVLWWLAFYYQWGLVERILTHYPVERVDINATLTYEGNPNRRTTVLWLLAFRKQWGLVERILTHYPVGRVDINGLNATHTHESNPHTHEINPHTHEINPHRGKTVLWLLAIFKQWGLVERVLTHYPIERVDINATPTYESNPNRGTTVLWWLAVRKQWGLVERILTHYPVERVDINATPTHEINPHRGKTVLFLAAQEAQWKIVHKLLAYGASTEALNSFDLDLHLLEQVRKLQAHCNAWYGFFAARQGFVLRDRDNLSFPEPVCQHIAKFVVPRGEDIPDNKFIEIYEKRRNKYEDAILKVIVNRALTRFNINQRQGNWLGLFRTQWKGTQEFNKMRDIIYTSIKIQSEIKKIDLTEECNRQIINSIVINISQLNDLNSTSINNAVRSALVSPTPEPSVPGLGHQA